MVKTDNSLLKSNLKSVYDEQYNNSMTEWRETGGKYKAFNIIALCKGYEFSKVLEVGAGEGSILTWLDKYNFTKELYAIEISESGVSCINKRNIKSLKNVQIFDGYKIPFDDNFFDLVICSHVIEHVEYPRLLLREIKRVSKHQLFEIPVDFSLSVDKKINHFLSYGHINIFTPALFRFLLLSEGFEIIKDKISLYSKEIHKHILRTKRRELNTSHYMKFLFLQTLRRFLWYISPKKLKDLKPQTYTVLCVNKGKSLKIFS